MAVSVKVAGWAGGRTNTTVIAAFRFAESRRVGQYTLKTELCTSRALSPCISRHARRLDFVLSDGALLEARSPDYPPSSYCSLIRLYSSITATAAPYTLSEGCWIQ